MLRAPTCPSASAYCASKFGLTGLTEALADEGKEHGIRAIELYPGAMATSWGNFSPEERQQSEPNEAPRRHRSSRRSRSQAS